MYTKKLTNLERSYAKAAIVSYLSFSTHVFLGVNNKQLEAHNWGGNYNCYFRVQEILLSTNQNVDCQLVWPMAGWDNLIYLIKHDSCKYERRDSQPCYRKTDTAFYSLGLLVRVPIPKGGLDRDRLLLPRRTPEQTKSLWSTHSLLYSDSRLCQTHIISLILYQKEGWV